MKDEAAPPRPSALRRGVQFGSSLVILALLVAQVDRESWATAWAQSKPLWLLGAILLKSLTLMLHEYRLWLAFESPRPPMLRVFAIGLAAGVINLVAPGRAGDFASIAMLHRDCGVRVGAATSAVGMVAVLEAAMLGVFLLVILGVGAINFELVYQNLALIQRVEMDATGQVEFLFRLIGFGLLGGLVLGAGALWWWVRRERVRDVESRTGLRAVVMDTVDATMGQLSSPGNLAANVLLAGLQVIGMVGAFAMALTAVGIDVPYPWVAAAAILLLSSVAAIGLPPALAAGPALASMAVLPIFGVGAIDDLTALASDPRILAYTGAYWIISQLPAAVFGIPFLSGGMALLREGSSEEPAVKAEIPDYSRLWAGCAAGLLGGMVAGGTEALVVLSQAGTGEYRALLIGAVFYALLGLVPGFGIGLMVESSRRVFGPRIRASRLFGWVFALVGMMLGQGILSSVEPLLQPISPLVEAWWIAWVLIANGLVLAIVLWLVPIFVERTSLRRVLEFRGLAKLSGALFLFAALFSVAPGQSHQPRISNERPMGLTPPGSQNIVLILVDGLRADFLGSYGSTSGLTPSIDALAEESIRFDRVIAQAPVTAPSMASVMTGSIPTAHGCRRPGCRLPDGVTTVAEVLREHGYSTAMVANQPDVFQEAGFDQGFDYYQDCLPDPLFWDSWSADRLLWIQRLGRMWDGARSSDRRVERYYWPADRVLLDLQEVISANREQNSRFFVVGHLMEPHSPFFDWDEEGITGDAYGPIWTGRGPGLDGERLRATYAEEVWAVDREIGRFVEWLETEELDDTVLIVAGLQGQALGEHGVYWEGASVNTESVRVPLLIRLPDGELGGSVATWQVRLQDLSATLAVVAGATYPDTWQSIDLLDGLAMDGLTQVLEAEIESLDRTAISELDEENSRLQAYRTGVWSYIRGCEPESSLDQSRAECVPLENGAENALYRTIWDPDEENDLWGQEGRVQSEMAGALREEIGAGEALETERNRLMDSISGCAECREMEAVGQVLDCTNFCGED